MEYLIAIVLGAIGSLIAAEIGAIASRFAKRLVVRAADNMPMHERDRYREEWLAHLNACAGSMTKLMHGLGCHLACWQISKGPSYWTKLRYDFLWLLTNLSDKRIVCLRVELVFWLLVWVFERHLVWRPARILGFGVQQREPNSKDYRKKLGPGYANKKAFRCRFDIYFVLLDIHRVHRPDRC